ncbi:MAG: type II toxin-antitoxin system ParD family antitoxin [Terracidiphilus sp.]|jgi:putative addiction module CopG family antidote
MPTLNIELNDDDQALIANLIESGQFHSAGEVVLEGLRLLEADRKPDSSREEGMRNAIRSGLDDLSQGRSVALNDPDEIASHIRALGERAARQSS